MAKRNPGRASVILPERLLAKMDPADRPPGVAGLTADEASSKATRRLEREEQRLLASWLALQKGKRILQYDWSATNRRVSCRIGMPDFKIWKEGRALLGEMKLPGSQLEKEQREVHAEFAASGTQVQIWASADVAIRQIKNWLWENWRHWEKCD